MQLQYVPDAGHLLQTPPAATTSCMRRRCLPDSREQLHVRARYANSKVSNHYDMPAHAEFAL
jgi:hypothetical protein